MGTFFLGILKFSGISFVCYLLAEAANRIVYSFKADHGRMRELGKCGVNDLRQLKTELHPGVSMAFLGVTMAAASLVSGLPSYKKPDWWEPQYFTLLVFLEVLLWLWTAILLKTQLSGKMSQIVLYLAKNERFRPTELKKQGFFIGSIGLINCMLYFVVWFAIRI